MPGLRWLSGSGESAGGEKKLLGLEKGEVGSSLHPVAGQGKAPYECGIFQAIPYALKSCRNCRCWCVAHLCEVHTGDGTHGGRDLGQQTVHLRHRGVVLSTEDNDLIHFGEGSSHFGSDLEKQGRRVA